MKKSPTYILISSDSDGANEDQYESPSETIHTPPATPIQREDPSGDDEPITPATPTHPKLIMDNCADQAPLQITPGPIEKPATPIFHMDNASGTAARSVPTPPPSTPNANDKSLQHEPIQHTNDNKRVLDCAGTKRDQLFKLLNLMGETLDIVQQLNVLPNHDTN